MNTDEELLAKITNIMRSTFKGGARIPVANRATTANDVEGWDSLSHALLILNIESELDVELPLERTLELNNVGELIELLRETGR